MPDQVTSTAEGIATAATDADTAAATTDTSTTAPADGGTAPKPSDVAKGGALTSDERAELERLRGIHADEKKWEKRNRTNLGKLKGLAELLGIEADEFNPVEFDPKSEFERLRKEVESERTERTRADIARTKGVDPRYVIGASAEEMKSAADAYLADVQARIDAAVKASTTPATESTSTVKSGYRVEGPKQITTEAELAKLSPEERLKAYKDGRLDKLIGR